jgi:aspartyl-tRNA(Asn)/glutamyl-tRNA(Gln) amidotransferase subunit B
MPDGETVRVGIERLHLEQDAGKSLHDQNPSMSLVDLNRAGVALMEIVSKPDLRSADEAMAYFTKLRAIMRDLGTCDGDMEKGHLRADVNVSVRKPGDPLGTRCEIKNLNSIRFMGRAIQHEARRQVDIIEDGGKIEQETRLFDEDTGETRTMRTKEEAHDYRYFPDPDLLPLVIDEAYVDALKVDLPDLSDDKKARFIDMGLTADEAGVLIANPQMAMFFETVAKHDPANANVAAKWVINELFGRLNKEGLKFAQSPVDARKLSEILMAIGAGVLSTKMAKELLDILWTEGGEPGDIIERRGMRQMSDEGKIQIAIDVLFLENPDKVAAAKADPKALMWFVGQVMKRTGGKANPRMVNDLLKKKIDN